MTKIDIFSGFLGAGKTTLIKKLIKEAYAGERVVLIENEFGEIGIDGGFLADAGIEITEMNSGCICCSLVGDFSKALKKVTEEYHPERIIIEPSGVGKLSDVIRAVEAAELDDARLNSFTAVADVNKCKMYSKNFGEFYNDQIASASAIVLSHTQSAKDHKIEECVALLREKNPTATIVTTPWYDLGGADILAAIEKRDTLKAALEALEAEHKHHHEHHHDHGEGCTCGCHGHHHHHADEVFNSIGAETTKKYSKDELSDILEGFSEDTESFGMVLRAKGIVENKDGGWLHFDYVPGEPDIREGSAGIIGRLCVIGAGLNEEKIKELFGI